MSENEKCSAASCRNKPVGTIDRYNNNPYCKPHLIALEAMNEKRRPKPVITYFETQSTLDDHPENVESPNNLQGDIYPLRTNASKVAGPQPGNLVKKDEPVNWISTYVDAEVEKKKSKFKKRAAIFLVILGIGGVSNWYQSEQEQTAAVERLSARNVYASKCFAMTDEDESAKAGSVGSAARQNAVIEFYERVLTSECIEYGDGSIFENPFYNVNSNSDNWPVLVNAFKYTAERWNGIEPFVLRCRDGWNSPSIGKRGACSHHGGVVSGFNENKTWSLSESIVTTEPLYPPLYKLEEAIK